MSEQNMKLEKAAENTLARFVVQLITPVLLGLIAWLGARQLSAIETKQDSLAEEQAQQSRKTTAIASDVRDLNTRFDVMAVRRLDELEKRVDRVEQATKTP
ncbi:hypothetical protein [Pseudoxanthomonas indica]|uniref:Uncharacterized protein n=1 Tax=Pseudoxanthomonas indica TaxID=428993 RepID=A0A1T5K0Z0_9GAMM|nr:hypothetical protein [Pseudoxanthomonas indica]GGD45760.1 hypothetical protein GCM10007235_17140 [Pseudoxanthomonas indica]SKC57210.1 hypothetical protein SAMN06296058_1255 [Pseudoxanthomonas indica]